MLLLYNCSEIFTSWNILYSAHHVATLIIAVVNTPLQMGFNGNVQKTYVLVSYSVK